MKLLFDLQALQNGSRTRGIGRYVRSLFDALARRDDIELYAVLNGAFTDTLDAARDHAAARIGASRVLVFPGLTATSVKFPENKGRRSMSEALYEAFVAQVGCDALLVGSVVEGFHDDTAVSMAAPQLPYVTSAVLYDLIPMTDPSRYLDAKFATAWYGDCIRQMNAADVLLAISDYTGREAAELLKRPLSEVAVISTGIDHAVFAPAPVRRDMFAHFGLSKPFVMHASAVDERKNFEGLIDAFGALPLDVRTAHQLVLAGMITPDGDKQLRARAATVGIAPADIIITGHVSDDELLALYRACRLFVFPSHYEGFGLPPLEAMACGSPAIGSNVTSIPEVIGDPAYTFDPHNTAQISQLMGRLLSDEKAWTEAKAHATRHASAFSWEKVAEAAVMALKAAVAARPSSERQAGYPSAQAMAAHVATRVDLTLWPAADIEQLASCLAAAEDELVAKCADAIASEGKIWRVEGAPYDSTYSLALVNRETARAMAELGWQVALQNGEGAQDAPVNPDFEAANRDLITMHARAGAVRQQESFAVSRLNYPPRVSDMAAPINALHHYAWEETGYPHAWVEDFNQHLTMITTLATHIEKILIDNGVSVPMVTSGCGVDHWERIVPDETYHVEARSFRFLHVSSCFPRKGVDALLVAYGEAFSIDDDVSLVIKTFDNPHNDVREQLAALQAQNSRYPHVVMVFGDISDSELKSLYGQCHVMVGPSFAEGYGLPFAEAMLTGIPVITTNWGGQLDFCNSGNSWLVDYRFERAGSHLGVWSSAWARVDVPSLVEAMRVARATSPIIRAAMAARGREQLLSRHKWTDVARRLSAAAATLPARAPRDPHVGWISTWNSKCGIATYSQHLVETMPGKVTVFAPEKEATLVGPDHSLRLWRQSKSLSHLGRILSAPAADDIDLFIIQFNFGFFNHADLANFIHQAKERGKKVIITLHATYKIELAPYENFQLDYIAPALAACDRILVHSISDLNNLKALGLIDNVALFPHGVLRRPDTPPARPASREAVIATYGFALPHKGLAEMVDALRLLHQRSRKVRLRMVNAEYPAEESASLIAHLKEKINDHGLGAHVEMHNQFLSDEESLALLTDADLIVFPYQHTGESASGAVRYGMAVERPVAVTPLPIFDDLDGATFRMPGTSAADLADGIAATLDALAANTPDVAATNNRAARWRDQHDYRVVGRRLFNICKALANR